MIKFVIGDILESEAECLVNTVNCEGYMGKGIAYQFKLRFPEMNKDYVEACKKGKLKIGSLHYFREKNKTIVNFPTKNKWREKSKIEYIEKGLSELTKLLPELNIKSIAIPPLGCGNGGLSWFDVKPIIVKYLSTFAGSIEILIFEPTKTYFKSKATEAPKLNASHLILMNFKLHLKKFNKLRLQKTAYFMNLFSGNDYFKFTKHKYGPYAHSIDILIKDIKQFQDFHHLKTDEALNLAKTTLISKSVEQKLSSFSLPSKKAIDFINSIKTDKELELLATICAVIEDKLDITKEEVIEEIRNWSCEKAEKFSEDEILSAINKLESEHIICRNIMGYYNLSNTNINRKSSTALN
ncbi:type II toxin-antitoxin system antitoxin DNA ADP-ribosyl glycohydrolase DarG [Thermincola ferriacetica]